MYYLRDNGGNLYQAYESLGDAVEAYSLDQDGPVASYMDVSLGVGFIDGDSSRPVFVVADAGRFTDCYLDQVFVWTGWYDLNWIEDVFEYM